MRHQAFLLAAAAAMLAAPAAGQVTDFRLQPAPTPTPQVIGPPPETPVPRPSPTPTPAPVPTIAAPVPTAIPRIALPAAPRPSPTPTQRASAATTAGRVTQTPVSTAATTTPPVALTSAVPAPGATASPPVLAPLPSLQTSTSASPKKPVGSWWPWIVAVFLVGGAGFGAAWWLRGRIGPLGPVIVPEIERPRVPPSPDLAPEPPPPVAAEAATAAPEHPLHIGIELRKLSLTMLNATLGYRLTLTNGGSEPLKDIAVAADLVGAHSSLPRELQLAGPETELPVCHRLAGLAPGESGDVTGELRIPLNQVRPIAQGRAQLFVPLARFRIGAEGEEPRCFTLVAGQPSPSGNGAIQPVRLDLGPRIYDGLAGRAF